MAAFGAAVSLKNTIQSLLESSRISLVPPSPKILQSAYDAMCFLQKVLLKLDDTGYSKIRSRVNALDERIKEIIWEFEDLLESHVYDQILPQLESSSVSERDHLPFSVDLQSLQQNLGCLVERLTMMEVEYFTELLDMPEEEGEPLSSRIDFCGINSNMVGLSGEFELVRDILIENEVNRVFVTGMAGIGKTTFVKKIFDDPSIQRHFELRAWVKVGKKCESHETLRCILAQVDPNTRHQMLTQGENDDDIEKLVEILEERLKNKKCLVVLDDIWKWDKPVMDNLRKVNARILFTSRIRLDKESHFLRVRLLDKEESKKLLGEKVFGEKGFPPYLQKLGEKIAEKCEGLPLMIVTVADLLAKANKDTQEELNMSIQEYWTEVAERKYSSVFEDAYNQIAEVFYPSYDYLPQFYKMLFLYSGACPPYSNIKLRRLVPCIIAEGIFEQVGKQTLIELKDVEQASEDVMDGGKTLEVFVVACLGVLGQTYHLFLFNFDQESWFSNKDCRVHSCWQHLCRKEASRIKFLHVLQSCDEVMNGQRRLCAHSNTLFAIKEVYDSIKSDCSSTVRSLLCHGPLHPYPMPIHAMDFKLLRALYAHKVRFYCIPLEIMKLICLKYLALTCNKELPVSISNLLHLQFLIIHPYVHIIKCGALPYMPMEIWDMQNLQHLYVEGRDLPTPNSNSNTILDKVTFISGVGTKSCTVEVLKRIPNLKHLSIIKVRKPYDDGDGSNSLSGLANISVELQNLSILKYHVVNPDMKWETMVPLSMFPSSLKVLTLSGLGYPW